MLLHKDMHLGHEDFYAAARQHLHIMYLSFVTAWLEHTACQTFECTSRALAVRKVTTPALMRERQVVNTDVCISP